MVVLKLFVFVEFNEGGAKAAVMTLVFVFFIACLLCSFFAFRRPYAGIFFLFFVLFSPRNSSLSLFSTYVVVLAAFLTFLHHHIFQKSSPSSFCLSFIFLLFFMVWLVLLCSRTYSIHLLFHRNLLRLLFVYSVSVCDHRRFCISLG